MQGNNRLWAVNFQKDLGNSISKITLPASHFWLLPPKKVPSAVQTVECLNQQYLVNRYMLHNNKKSIYLKTQTHLAVRVLRIIFILILLLKYCMWCSCTTENNQQSNKKEILINNQDNTYNSMKNFKRQQLLFVKTRIESEVSLKILSH